MTETKEGMERMRQEAEEAQKDAQQRLEETPMEEERLEESAAESAGETPEEREEQERLLEVAELAARLTLMHQRAWEQEAGEDLILARELRRLQALSFGNQR